jgi:hypothetical protein
MGERIFEDEELKAMGQRTLDVLLEAIGSGDQEAVVNLSKRMYAEFSAMHDLYRDWLTHTLSLIGRKYGDEALAEALRETVAGFTRRLAPRYEGKSLRRKVEILMAGLRGHLEPFKVEEDDEKITITPVVCGSGQRQIQQGRYEGPEGFLKIKKPQPMTFGRADFPVYCAHCYFQNVVPMGSGGDALFITEPAEKIGEGTCRVTIYKAGAPPKK